MANEPNQNHAAENAAAAPEPRKGHGYLWGFLSAIVLCIVLVVGVPLIIAATGVVNVSAQASWGPIDSFLDYASMQSVAYHAPSKKNPFANDPKAVAAGMDHFKENCLVCHGAPGVKPAELAEGLKPAPPNLASDDTQGMSDGQLYWVVTHGIGSTGMPAFAPTHTKSERWQIVSFLRYLPHLTDKEKATLRAGGEEESHHHHGDKEGDSHGGGESGHDHGSGEAGHGGAGHAE